MTASSKSVQSESNPQSGTSEAVGAARDSPGYSFHECFLLFLTAFAVRMVHVFSLKISPIFSYKIGDSEKYDLWARELAGGDWIGSEVFYQAPLYPYFLGSIYHFIGDDLLTVRRVQAFLGALSCVFLMKATGKLFGRRAGWIAGLTLAFYAPSIFLEGLVQKAVLDLFFLSLLLWLLAETTSGKFASAGRWVLIGVAAGALSLTRENALVLLPILGIWVLLGTSGSGLKGRCLCGIGLFAGLLLTLGPVVIRNYSVGGQVHLTTSQFGPNFYIGNNPQANGTYRPLLPGRGDARFEKHDATWLAEQETGRKLTPKEVSQFYLAKSINFIRNEPAEWFQLTLRKAAMTINANEIIDTEDQYTVADWSPVLKYANYVFHFGMLVPIALIGIWTTRSRWRELWCIHLITLAFGMTVVFFFVFGRYRFPLVPMLIPFASIAIVQFWDSFAKGEWRQFVVCYLVPFVLLFIACNVRLASGKSSRGITLSNYGVQAMIRSDFLLSERFLTEAAACSPESAVIHNNLGVLYRETGRLDDARNSFRKALELEPSDQKIQENFDRLNSRQRD